MIAMQIILMTTVASEGVDVLGSSYKYKYGENAIFHLSYCSISYPTILLHLFIFHPPPQIHGYRWKRGVHRRRGRGGIGHRRNMVRIVHFGNTYFGYVLIN